MAYTEVTTGQSVLTWTNPHGGTSQATIIGGVVTELIVTAVGGGNIIYSTDTGDLTHLNTVLTDLIAFLNSEL